MTGPTDPASLAPIPRPGVRRKLVGLVFVSTLLAVLAVGTGCVLTAWLSLNHHIHEIYPAVIRENSEGVLEQLDRSNRAIAEGAADRSFAKGLAAAAARKDRSTPDTTLLNQLSGVFLRTKVFSSMVALDGEGQVLAAVGPSPKLAAVLDVLEPKNALDSSLDELMLTAQLRKQLSDVGDSSIQMLQVRDLPSFPLASSSLRDHRGNRIGSVHGFVSRDGLDERLSADMLGANANVLLTEKTGHILATARPSEPSTRQELHEVILRKNRDSTPEHHWNDGAWTLTAVHTLGEYGLNIVIEQPVLSAYAPVLKAVTVFGVVGILTVLGMVFWASRVSRVLMDSIEHLYHGLRSAARGELVDQNLPLRGAVGEFESLLIAFNAMADRMRAHSHESETHHRALREQNQAFQQHHVNLQKLSVTDELTQLHNHRFFQDHLGHEIKRLDRSGDQLVLLLIDIDFFKNLNDAYGHAAGDEFLRQIARIMAEIVRSTDLLARYGGEEFVIVTTETTLEGAVTLAEKVRTAIAEASFIVDDSMRPRKATVSIGVAPFNGSRTDLFNSADAALYRAKDSGRNCVMLAGEDDRLESPALDCSDLP